MSYDSEFGQMMANVFGGFDMAIFKGFSYVQNDIFTFLAKLFTCLGEPVFFILLSIVLCILCLFKRTRKIGFLLILGLIVIGIVNNIFLKHLFLRLRPYNVLQSNPEFFSWYMNVGATPETPFCFPSGHTCFTFCLTTILFIWINFDLKKRSSWLVFIIPVLVGCSRIYLMVHYPTDVIAGCLVGVACGILSWYIFIFIYKCIFNKLNIAKKINNIDFEHYLHKKISNEFSGKNVSLFIVLILCCFLTTTFIKMNNDLSHSERCNHQSPDYICMNGSSYDVYDEQTGEWKHYCMIHDN